MTISLVQLYTALTQILGEKVALGDNGEVEVYCTGGKQIAPIEKLNLIHSEGGASLLQIHIQIGEPARSPCVHNWQLLPEADAGYRCLHCGDWHTEAEQPPHMRVKA